jgi:TPP-dependent pyruvate/acetoin dehydrogenase alpha subunit
MAAVTGAIGQVPHLSWRPTGLPPFCSDPGHYRPKEEVAEWKTKDPITRFETRYLAEGLLTSEVIDSCRASVELELNDAVEFAQSSPSPLPESVLLIPC